MARFLTILCLNVVAAVAGCNRSPYELAPVSGRVTINDKPLFQGSVVFSPVAKGEEANAGKAATGRLQEDGTYRLTTYNKFDGAIVGEHWVTIINLDEENLPEGVPEYARIRVPERKVVAAGQENEINILLTRDEVRKYREDDR
jgi:hypothetical protein